MRLTRVSVSVVTDESGAAVAYSPQCNGNGGDTLSGTFIFTIEGVALS